MDTEPQGGLLAPGTLITDRLTVVRRIGTGGLGDVYEVDHKVTHHRRAVKVMHARHLHNEGLVERFLREASAAGRIRNPHIVETYDAGRMSNGTPFIVMEYLEGKPFDVVMRLNVRLDVELAAAVTLQVCAGVQAAHDAGIVHRDLKPENLFLTQRDGRAFVKVLDFGVSKFLLESEETDPGRSQTRPGEVMGTPLYMAPEQLNNARNADARCDVYSLGVMLYEMLAGRVPYVGKSLGELWDMVIRGEHQALHVVDGVVPVVLSDLVSRAMHVDPNLRVQSARELADAIEPYAKERTVSVLLEHDVVPSSQSGRSSLRPLAPRYQGSTRAPGDVPEPEGRVPTLPGAASPATADVADVTLVLREAAAAGVPLGDAGAVTQTQPNELPTDELAVVLPSDRAPTPLVTLEVQRATPPLSGEDTDTNPIVVPDGGEAARSERTDASARRPWAFGAVALVALLAVALAIRLTSTRGAEQPTEPPSAATTGPLEAEPAQPPAPVEADVDVESPPPGLEPLSPALVEADVDVEPPSPAPAGAAQLPRKKVAPPQHKPEIGTLIIGCALDVRCLVQVDGKKLEESRRHELQLKEGPHSISFEDADTHERKMRTVQVPANGEIKILAPLSGRGRE